ncbi:MAG: hypothetical protein J0L52_10680 [Caulobacterales bacterium]|nr:hypothetical protein [Caulobacterales bacterium]
MIPSSPENQERFAPMFAALCREVGFCLHPKGEARVIAALDIGLDAATRAVFDADGADFAASTGDLRRAVRDCLKAHLPD